MVVIFALARYFPLIGLLLGLTFLEAGRLFRRRGQKLQYSCFFMGVLLLGLAGVWIYFRGDTHSDQWVQRFFNLR
jgi:hypothetical protein